MDVHYGPPQTYPELSGFAILCFAFAVLAAPVIVYAFIAGDKEILMWGVIFCVAATLNGLLHTLPCWRDNYQTTHV